MIRARKECPEIGWGDFEIVRTDVAEALVLKYDWRHTSLVTIHNLADRPRQMRLQVSGPDGGRLVDVFSDQHSEADESGCHHLDLRPYDYRWYRVGAADNALNRSAL